MITSSDLVKSTSQTIADAKLVFSDEDKAFMLYFASKRFDRVNQDVCSYYQVVEKINYCIPYTSYIEKVKRKSSAEKLRQHHFVPVDRISKGKEKGDKVLVE